MTAPSARQDRKGLRLGLWLIALLIALALVIGIVAWRAWTRDAVTAADNDRNAVVQPSNLPSAPPRSSASQSSSNVQTAAPEQPVR